MHLIQRDADVLESIRRSPQEPADAVRRPIELEVSLRMVGRLVLRVGHRQIRLRELDVQQDIGDEGLLGTLGS